MTEKVAVGRPIAFWWWNRYDFQWVTFLQFTIVMKNIEIRIPNIATVCENREYIKLGHMVEFSMKEQIISQS